MTCEVLLQAIRTCREHQVWSEELLERSLKVFLQAFQQLASVPEAQIRLACAAGSGSVLKSVLRNLDE